MTVWAVRQKKPLQKGGRCREVAVSDDSTVSAEGKVVKSYNEGLEKEDLSICNTERKIQILSLRPSITSPDALLLSHRTLNLVPRVLSLFLEAFLTRNVGDDGEF